MANRFREWSNVVVDSQTIRLQGSGTEQIIGIDMSKADFDIGGRRLKSKKVGSEIDQYRDGSS